MGKIDKKEKKDKKDKKDKKEKKEKKEEVKAVVEKKEDDSFNVLTELKDTIIVDEEEMAAAKAKAEKKKLRKSLTDEEKEAQRKINRENREKKKEKKDLNKKRKKGELAVESDDEDDDEPKVDEEGNPIEPKPKKVKVEKKKKEIEYGIWVGNLAYTTATNTIRDFFKDCGEITRVKCPKGNGAKNNNKGFAYVFFASQEQATKAVEKSEQKLEGRSLLIKDSENFERKDGLPAVTDAERKVIKKQKNPPCPTLFIGNLSFQTKEEHIREAFEWAGDIRKVRMATFEDSGKCKGFGYVDYFTVESSTKAIRAPDKHMIDGRKARVEFAGEEAYKRSMPWILREEKKQKENPTGDGAQDQQQQPSERAPREDRPRREQPQGEFRERRERPKKPVSRENLKSGEALATAQRQKPTVQEFKGSKITFD